MYQHLNLEIKEGILNIDLNRPEVFNALNPDLLSELHRAFSTEATKEEVRLVKLSGGESKAFCSGADLKGGLSDTNLGNILLKFYNPLILSMVNLPKPIVCGLNGIAAGAGMSLALACDIIIAHEEAYFTELFVGIGLMPDAGSMYFLPRIVGMQRAFELCASGRKVYMPEALSLGLVVHVYTAMDYKTKIQEYCSQLANSATKSIAHMKSVLHQSLNSSLEEVLNLEAEGQTKLGYSKDFSEGVMSFIQKRKPQFIGQ
jgi:2-(1,2-epoxy-1,2-dihydrophenyl)acetyl-CoA isomerase